jgi:VCBS repeat-containing protein
VTDTFADVTGQLDATDVDSGAVLSYALAAGEDGVSPYGVLTVAANGSYTFVPNAAAINALAVGDDQTVVFDVSVSDGIAPAQVTTLTISITAANDVPVIVAEAAGTLVDTGVTDTFADVTGQLDATDVDSGAVLSYALAAGEDGLSPYGVLTVNANGSYTFVPDAAAINALAVGDDQTVVFDVSVSDGIAPAQVTTLTISITAANDVPVAVADTGTASENETKFFDVVGNDTDVDVPDTKTLTDIGTIAVSSANPAINGLVLPAGVFTIVGNQLKFLPGTAFDALNPTEVATVTVGYTMADTAGATSTSTLTLTVNGDAENGTANDDLLSGTNNPDAINGLGGDDTIVALGGNDTINAGDGDDQVDGGSGNDQIHGDAGDDDLDGGSGDDVFYGEAGDDTYDGGSHIAGDEIHFTGERSEYTVTKSGTTYTIVHNVDSSSPGYTGIDTVTRVEKFYFGAGPTLYTGDAVLDPPPAPAVPEAIDDTLAASLTEDSSIVFAIGNVGSNDTGGGPLTYSGWNGTSAVSIVQGTYGTFQFNADGTVLYQLDSALADELSPADHVQDHALYRVSGPGGADTGTVSVNITGANDAPVLSADTFAALAENAVGNFAVLANDADPEDDPLQISSLVALTNANISGLDHFLNATELATLNSYFTIGVGGQSIVFNPGAGLGVSGVQSLFDSLGVGQNATINISYKVSDGSLESTGTLTFTVNGAIETYNGTAGNDAWTGIQGVSERFIGNGGIDQVTYGNMATGVYVNLATGATGGSAAGDILEGITRVFGSRVAGDEIIGSNNNDRIYGLGGDDLLSGAGGNDFIWGGLGSDIITGNEGDDTMFGEEGDDVIDGGLGADSYLGGSGRDVFVFKNLEVAGTKDSIVDFQDGLDTIEFTRSAMHLASDFDFSDFTVVGNGTKTVELFWNDIDGGLHRIRIDSSTGDPMTIGVSDFSMLA